ncbi:MAG: hypothetical protein Q9160_000840 [Pyrenula sp. 1 TL-2023]
MTISIDRAKEIDHFRETIPNSPKSILFTTKIRDVYLASESLLLIDPFQNPVRSAHDIFFEYRKEEYKISAARMDPLSLSLSPTKARQAATTAKSWATVATWLTAKYHPQSVPRFERNEDTLRILLELVDVNERADELAGLVEGAAEAEVEVEGGQARSRRVGEKEEGFSREEFMRWIDEGLRQSEDGDRDAAHEGEGTVLDDLASSFVTLGCLSPASFPVEAAQALISLTQSEFASRSQLAQLQDLQRQIDMEIPLVRTRLESLRTVRSGSSSASEIEALSNRISEWTRGSKMLSLKIREYEDRASGLQRADWKGVEIEEIREKERRVGRLQERCRGLERGLRAFGGLPPDWEAAKGEVERVEEEVGELRRQRDGLFEGMVEGGGKGRGKKRRDPKSRAINETDTKGVYALKGIRKTSSVDKVVYASPPDLLNLHLHYSVSRTTLNFHSPSIELYIKTSFVSHPAIVEIHYTKTPKLTYKSFQHLYFQQPLQAATPNQVLLRLHEANFTDATGLTGQLSPELI